MTLKTLLERTNDEIAKDNKAKLKAYQAMIDSKSFVSKNAIGDNFFYVLDRDVSNMVGPQDKFQMFLTDGANKIIKDFGSHTSDAGAQKFMKNNLDEITSSNS